MTRAELTNLRQQNFCKNEYQMRHWRGWKYSTLKDISYIRKRGRSHSDERYNDVIIFADTETSKSGQNGIIDVKGFTKYIPVTNYVVAWTISIRAYHHNLITLYGSRPSEMAYCLDLIRQNLPAENTFIFFHNLSYDWIFIKKFLIQRFGVPVKQLSTKPHFPIYIGFENGLILKDTLSLAQRSLDKWAKDLGVDTKKAVGLWDYDKIRNQEEHFTADELTYIEHDTLAGAECVDKFLQLIRKELPAIPYTATGIPREALRKIGKEYKAHKLFKAQAPDFNIQQILECCYHGGYTHGNRAFLNRIIRTKVICHDFSSSYPYCMLSEQYPAERFMKIDNCYAKDILELSDKRAFIFKLTIINPRLKDYDISMPALQFSKCTACVNPILDNGRLLACKMCCIYLTEIDLKVIMEQYDYDSHICTEVHTAIKDYLPRWFTDYIYALYKDKTNLKGVDPVLYALQKATLNSCYGMCVMKPLRDELTEDYKTGEYVAKDFTDEENKDRYKKYLDNKNIILPFQWGVYVTSYAFRNLFELAKCAGTFIYSDTDSVYGYNWNNEKLEAYNNQCKDKLKANGYGAVNFNGREYWLGVAEKDGEYSEFMVQGAKRYCGRSTKDNELHITVAGVPKKGSALLNNDINNFRPGFIFSGTQTGKKLHTYIFTEKITKDKNGNEIGDSIDLTPCDYLLDSTKELADWGDFINTSVEISAVMEVDKYES